MLEAVATCDLCGAALHDAGSVGEWGLLECPSCGVLATSPRPTTSSIAGHYDADYGCFEPELSRFWSWAGRLRAVRDGYVGQAPLHRRVAPRSFGWLFHLRVPGPPAGRFLELGCGGGRNVSWASGVGWNAFGLEPSADAAATADKGGMGCYAVVCGRAEEVCFRPGSFRLVLMSHSLEHCHRPSRALQQALEALEPGGRLVVTVPKVDSVGPRLLGAGWMNWCPPLHLWHFTEASLRRAVERAGFVVQEVRPSSVIVGSWRLCRQRVRLGRWWRRPATLQAESVRRARSLSDCVQVTARKPGVGER